MRAEFALGEPVVDRHRSNAWYLQLALVGVAVLSLAGLLTYHLRLLGGGVPSPSGLAEGFVAAQYGLLGFEAAFLMNLLALAWVSIWFFTGEVERPLVRAGRVGGLVLALSVLLALDRDGGASARAGAVGAFFAPRLVSILGFGTSCLLFSAVVLAALLLATDFFFYRYFEGLGRRRSPGVADEVEVEAVEVLKSLRTALPEADDAASSAEDAGEDPVDVASIVAEADRELRRAVAEAAPAADEVVRPAPRPPINAPETRAAAPALEVEDGGYVGRRRRTRRWAGEAVEPADVVQRPRRARRRRRWEDEEPQPEPEPEAVAAEAAPAPELSPEAIAEADEAAEAVVEAPPVPDGTAGSEIDAEPDDVDLAVEADLDADAALDDDEEEEETEDDEDLDADAALDDEEEETEDDEDLEDEEADDDDSYAETDDEDTDDEDLDDDDLDDEDLDDEDLDDDDEGWQFDADEEEDDDEGVTLGETDAAEVEVGPVAAEPDDQPMETPPGGRPGVRQGRLFGDDSLDDELVDAAARLVITENRASTNLLRRRLAIPIELARDLMDALRERGVVEFEDGAGHGTVLMDLEEWLAE